MKRQILFIYFLLIIKNSVLSQIPYVKQFDYRFGGTLGETLNSFQPTTDGGFILGGYTNSPSGGDVSEPNRDSLTNSFDYWTIKIDSLGIKQWDKRFGGNKSDYLYAMKQTPDGGFIFGGTSSSGISGDKSQPNWDITNQLTDFWVVKSDVFGNKQWDYRYGGTEGENFYSLCVSSDGGYLLGGISMSGISGDKSQPSWDTTTTAIDMWVIKIDSLGNKEWDKRFGGIGSDYLFSLIQTCDGGYLLGGMSRSDISGDKSQSSWHNTGGYPTFDYWIIKTNAVGNKEWDKRFGGTGNDNFTTVLQTSDGGYILGGYADSGINGDKSQANWGARDFWILKTDSLGNKQWDKSYGGTLNEDDLGNITQTCDGGYLIAGTSYSDSSGVKTENNFGPEQTWILKIDQNGLFQWDNTLFTNTLNDDERGYAFQTQNGCYVIANSTQGDIGGDKTQSSQGNNDFWLIKFCDSTLYSCIAPSPCNFNVGINSDHIISELSVFPNPFFSVITISIHKENIRNVTILIHNILGQNVFFKEEINRGNFYEENIYLGELTGGVYILEITIDGKSTYKKIVKN